MKQFDICRLKAAGGKGKLAGLVLVLQADLMDQIETRVVAPLVPINALPAMAKLRPEFVIEGKRLRLIADRMSVLRRKTYVSSVVSISVPTVLFILTVYPAPHEYSATIVTSPQQCG